jgi:transcriptional regulator with PAS, ATPase and Fis domain
MMIDLNTIKNKYGVIGHSPDLDYALHIAIQVAPTDLSVLILGESGVGKEIFAKIIHDNSPRKHARYITVNCGAIPEGTIDSELFGHEKGAFTGAGEARKGYFETANDGTIFLDEVAELPLSTQVRLLRVLETGDYMKVGSSKTEKINVRVIAATNVNMTEKIAKGKFREDLYYRLNTIPIHIPPLRDRKGDIELLFNKFAADFANKYKMPKLTLTPDAVESFNHYTWSGNIRQLKNITEQMSLLETNRIITADTFHKYISSSSVSQLPVLLSDAEKNNAFEKEIMYQVIADMKREIYELKKILHHFIQNNPSLHEYNREESDNVDDAVIIEDNLSIIDKEKELISKSLDKHHQNRKAAAIELGISERTLYRKIKELGL